MTMNAQITIFKQNCPHSEAIQQIPTTYQVCTLLDCQGKTNIHGKTSVYLSWRKLYLNSMIC